MMVDKTCRDWLDVEDVRAMIREGQPRKAIKMHIAALSHLKYLEGRASIRGHDLRQSYRRWLNRQAFKPFKGMNCYGKKTD